MLWLKNPKQAIIRHNMALHSLTRFSWTLGRSLNFIRECARCYTTSDKYSVEILYFLCVKLYIPNHLIWYITCLWTHSITAKDADTLGLIWSSHYLLSLEERGPSFRKLWATGSTFHLNRRAICQRHSFWKVIRSWKVCTFGMRKVHQVHKPVYNSEALFLWIFQVRCG